jgi:hypothetical protein
MQNTTSKLAMLQALGPLGDVEREQFKRVTTLTQGNTPAVEAGAGSFAARTCAPQSASVDRSQSGGGETDPSIGGESEMENDVMSKRLGAMRRRHRSEEEAFQALREKVAEVKAALLPLARDNPRLDFLVVVEADGVGKGHLFRFRVRDGQTYDGDPDDGPFCDPEDLPF